MSVKHVKKYYDEVAQQYMDMRNELNDFAELSKNNLFPPEKLESIKQSIQPLLRNYEVLSYIMFLLNMPNKKEKSKKYEKANKKLLKSLQEQNKKNGILQENKNIVDELHTQNSLCSKIESR